MVVRHMSDREEVLLTHTGTGVAESEVDTTRNRFHARSGALTPSGLVDEIRCSSPTAIWNLLCGIGSTLLYVTRTCSRNDGFSRMFLFNILGAVNFLLPSPVAKLFRQSKNAIVIGKQYQGGETCQKNLHQIS